MSSPLAASSPISSPSEAAGPGTEAPRESLTATPAAAQPVAAQAPALIPSRILDWDGLLELAADRGNEYRTAQPFPHIALDGLFAPQLLDQAIAELPGPAAHWKEYDTADERKRVCSDAAAFGPTAEVMVHALNSAPFLRFLERLTGIHGLIPDPHLHAAGYMRVAAGGFLGLHYDFATQRELKLDRRINVLLYLNRDWRHEWGGQLELHSNDPLSSPAHQKVEVEPLFNRLLIFNTPHALHGHPREIACPPGRARLCLSWYYYTAPPVPGWALRNRSVRFPGRLDPVRLGIKAVNLLTPPILLKLAQALRRRRL